MNFWLKMKKPIMALAPMAGITDSAFRQLCKDFGADVLYTEMISADGLHYGSKKTLELLKFCGKEKPIVLQLFGKRPECFQQAAYLARKAGFDGIDINFGCPARKVVAHGGGVALMRNFKLCREIILNTLGGSDLPVSIKVRTGIDDIFAADFIDYLSDLPLSAVMAHGRTYEQGFSGKVDFQAIRKIKQKFKKIVIANGGIFTPQDAKEMLEKTNVDGIGLARGLYGRPWLFKQVKQYLEKGDYQKYGKNQIIKIAIKHLKYAYKAYKKRGIIETRKHLAWYIKGFPGANELRKKLVLTETIAEAEQIFKDYLKAK